MLQNAKWFIEDDVLKIQDFKGIITLPSASEIYSFITQKTDNIRGLVPDRLPINSGENLNFSRYPLELSLLIKCRVKENDAILSVEVMAKGGDWKVEIEEIGLRQADHIYINGTWYPFIKGALEEVKKILEDAGIQVPESITLRQYLELRKAKSNSIIIDLTGNQLSAANISEKLYSTGISPALNARLYPYQEMGFQWLDWMADQGLGSILADEMGLGKTLQVIALITERAHRYGPALVITPATLLENWRREIQKFSPGLKTIIHSGSDRTGFPSYLKEQNVVITSYGIAVNDLTLLGMVDWDIVAIDEAQAIRNPDSVRSVQIRKLSGNIRIAITGTPIENQIQDLWTLSEYVVPGYLGSRENFLKTYSQDMDSAARLEPLVSPIILRRMVNDVAKDLPERIDIPVPLTMSEYEEIKYEQIRQETLQQYGSNGNFAALVRLSMFCTHPFLVDGEKSEDPTLKSKKYTRLTEILDEIFSLRHRVLIFTGYIRMVDLFLNDLPQRFKGIHSSFIDGRVKTQDRQIIIDKFNNNSQPGVLVLNPHAAGVGLNITGARHVIHYNLQWNPAVEDQATARAYRRGQNYPVSVHRMFYIDTLEEVMNDALAFKRGMAKTAVVGVDGTEPANVHLLRALNITPLRERQQ